MKTWVFGVSWQNAGNLVTRGMGNHIDFTYIEGDLSTGFEFPDNVKPLAVETMLGPKQSVLGPHIPKEGSITEAQIDEMGRGDKNLFIFGWAKYFDGFLDTPERVTKFCFQVRFTGNPSMPFVFPPCSRHNCSDEGCDEDK